MGITDVASMGKTQIDGIKMQMEVEQTNLAAVVCSELNERGFPCEVKSNGQQVMRAGVIPVRIERLRIASTVPLSPDKQKRFDVLKDRLTKEYAVMRQEQYKEEIKKLKQSQK